MKKNLVLPALAGTLLAAMVLAGCASSTDLGVFDPSVPESQQCYLQITGTVVVTQFDDIVVDWSPEFRGGSTKVTIPAGSHTFGVSN